MLIWEEVKCEKKEKSFLGPGLASMWRTKVPGGWLVRIVDGAADSAFFYPDPEHLWDSSSLS